MEIKFEEGKTYTTRSICDSEMKISITVAKRTAKRLTTTEGKTLGIFVYEGVEHVRPWGRYSMCPIIGADDCQAEAVKVETKPEPEQSFAELTAEGEKLFTPEQFEEIKNLIRKCVTPAPVKKSAQIINFADYKKKA